MILRDFVHIFRHFPPRVYFDVFRQNSCFNFRPPKQSSFDFFGVCVHSRGNAVHQNRVRCMFLGFLYIVEGGGGPLINVFLGSILTFFDKVRVLIFASQNRVRSKFLQFL